MNPADFIANPQAWLQHQPLPAQTTSIASSSSAQPAHYVQQQQQRATNFAGSSIPTTSTTSQYSQHALSNASPAPTNLNPFYSLSSGSANGNGIGSSGSTGSSSSTFYPQAYLPGFYYQTNTSIPVSTYSSLSGATTVPPSAQQSSSTTSVTQLSLSQPQARQQAQQSSQQQLGQLIVQTQQQSQPQLQQTTQQPPQQQQPQPQQHVTLNSQQSQQINDQQQSSTHQTLAIDPSLVGLNGTNPYMNMTYYRYPQQSNGQQPTTTSMAQMYQMQSPVYQYMQVPQVVSPAQLMRSPNSYPNVSASRPPSVQHPGTSQTPPVVNGTLGASVAVQQPVASSSGAQGPLAVPSASSLVYKDILTPQTLDKQPETVAHSLLKRLEQCDYSDINLATRLDILAKIRDNAGRDFYKVWARSDVGMDVLKDWLKTITVMEGWDETLMPLLFVIDRLPVGIEMLTSSKIGRIVKRVVKDPPNAAAKDLATNIETKWRALIPSDLPEQSGPREDDDVRSKKRKLEAPAPRAAPPKKQAIAPPKPTVVKKVTVQPTKDSKVDSSFFSSKPKPKLPSFRKIPSAQSAASKKEEPDSAVAQPSSMDPFQEAMKLMHMGKNTPPPAAPSMESSNSLTGTPPLVVEAKVMLGKNGMPKKKVTFPTDDKLVLIKYIERAIYEDERTGEEMHHSSYRDLDIDEGHALHATMFEEQIDFYEPQLIEFPEDVLERLPRGTESTEIAAQEEREKSALMAVYMSPAHIPDTPSDLMPGFDAAPDESQVVMMLPGGEVASLEAPAAPIVTASLQDLLAKISGNKSQAAPQQQFGVGSYNGQYAGYVDQGPEEEVSWGTGSGGGGDDTYGVMHGQQHDTLGGNNGGQQQGGWNGHGLPPPTGGQFSDEWDSNPPPQSRGWGGGAGGSGGQKQRQQQGRSNIPAGIKINAPCKFYNGPFGQVKNNPLSIFSLAVCSPKSFFFDTGAIRANRSAGMEALVLSFMDNASE
ncbi:hypothetical protein FRB96_008708 [Tulasnella sp. 330]|nr:hypothetical protein FRB96_008708 [Tulasnella sp. 330]